MTLNIAVHVDDFEQVLDLVGDRGGLIICKESDNESIVLSLRFDSCQEIGRFARTVQAWNIFVRYLSDNREFKTIDDEA